MITNAPLCREIKNMSREVKNSPEYESIDCEIVTAKKKKKVDEMMD